MCFDIPYKIHQTHSNKLQNTVTKIYQDKKVTSDK